MSRIQRLRISHFRNIKHADVNTDAPFVCFSGENAQGKTNILESIYLATNIRPFRTGGINDWVTHGQDNASVTMSVSDEIGDYKTGYDIKKGARTFFIDGNKLGSVRDVISRLRILSYNPSSYELILGDDSERRKFFDRAVYFMDTRHIEDVIYYNKALKSRNAAIKQRGNYKLWDTLIATSGERIISKRIESIGLMQEYFDQAFGLFFNDKSRVTFSYKPSAGYTKDEIVRKLYSDVKIDEQRGVTNSGPHRDRIEVYLNGKDAKRVVSTGQAKLIAFLFKVAKVRFIKKVSGKKPVFLYDDVSAFLDEQRLCQLVEIIKKEDIQIISTSVDNNLFRRLFSDSVKFITVRSGSVIDG
ncbi:MAG: DNA replication and repair protein RecF [Pseudomonadota bacterium]